MPAKPPKITSNFAILDVTRGRRALAKHFADVPPAGACPPEFRIPVTITGYVERQHSRDDGTSIEFAICVERVKLGGSE